MLLALGRTNPLKKPATYDRRLEGVGGRAGAVPVRIEPELGENCLMPLSVGLALSFAAHIPFSFLLPARCRGSVRKPMGEWLQANGAAGEAITSESAGYVDYYSRRLLYDYPGLTSKRVVRICERLGATRNNMFELIEAARPTWIVLRPHGGGEPLGLRAAGLDATDRRVSADVDSQHDGQRVLVHAIGLRAPLVGSR
jgi:hypothetical protein